MREGTPRLRHLGLLIAMLGTIGCGKSTGGSSASGASPGATSSGAATGTSRGSSGTSIATSSGSSSSSGSVHADAGIEVLDGLQLTLALTLSSDTVSRGQRLTGTATLHNPTNASISLLAADIAARPPGGTNAGGPYL